MLQSKDNVSHAIYVAFNLAFSVIFFRVAAAEPARRSSVSEERATTCYRQRADTDKKSPTDGQLGVVSPPDSDMHDVGTSTEAKQAEVKSAST